MSAKGDRLAEFLSFVVLILFGLSLLVVAVPGLTIILAFTGFGLPVAFLMWLAPTAFVLLFLFLLFYSVIKARWPIRLASALGLSLALLSLPPLLLNGPIERQAESLTSADHNDLHLPLGRSSIAVRKAYNYERRTTQCDGFCLHALLSGAADRVLIALSSQPESPPIGGEQALEFSIQKLKVCPVVAFKPGWHTLDLPTESEGKDLRVNAVDLMKLRIANGECLVERRTTLKDAEVVITQGEIKRALRPLEAGFDLAADTVAASRLNVYFRTADGAFVEAYRRTSINYYPFGPLYLPVIHSGSEFKMGSGWWRWHKTINVDYPSTGAVAWGAFLTGTLGLNLTLDGRGAEQEIFAKIENALSANRGVTRSEWDAFANLFDRIALGNRAELDEHTYRLALRILDDPRYPPPPRLYKLVASSRGSAEILAHLGSVFMARAAAGVTWSESLNVHEAQSLSNLSTAIAALPEEALKPHFDALAGLSLKPEVREHAPGALSRLSIFGDAAVPTLLRLVSTGLSGGKGAFQSNTFQHPYLAGMIGLCRAGPTARSALPQMTVWLQQGLLPMHGSYGVLAAATMIRLGASSEQLWPSYSAANDNAKRDQFERLAQASLENVRDCRY